MREVILPAHQLLNASKDDYQPLIIPSAQYDTLRATLIQAEQILLRVLGFELQLTLPLAFLPRYLNRTLEAVTKTGEDYDTWTKEDREEYGVLHGIIDTGIGRACRGKVLDA